MTLLNPDHQAPPKWHDTLPITSRYTYGLAGERFFRALQNQGQILGTWCRQCKRLYVPGRLYCERCLNELTEWEDVGLTGELHAFTVLHVNLDGSRKTVPDVVGFVKFGDGGIVHKLHVSDPSTVKIGMLVEAVLKPASQREGSILDILYFKPVAI